MVYKDWGNDRDEEVKPSDSKDKKNGEKREKRENRIRKMMIAYFLCSGPG